MSVRTPRCSGDGGNRTLRTYCGQLTHSGFEAVFRKVAEKEWWRPRVDCLYVEGGNEEICEELNGCDRESAVACICYPC